MSVGNLYEAIVPVESQGDTERRQALHKAMWQVLVKLTGDSAIVDDERAKSLINEAQSYVQQYRYLESTGDDSVAGLRLWTGFDSAAVNRALQRLGIATWGSERPATLIWLAVDGEGGRQLAGMEQAAQYLDPLTRQAQERGLPLLLPLMDLEDTTRLSPADIAGGSISTIRDASERYPADVVLAVSLTGVGGDNISARWTLLSEEIGNDSWSSDGDSLEAVLSAGINRLADMLARHYAPRTFAGEATRIELTVNAINSLDDYARAQRYLAGLSSVSQVDVVAARPGHVVFGVKATGGGEALDQAIAIGRTLRPDNSGAEGGRSYRLLP
ncbi:MAG: DUF2066 domain-containing protein [Gammaproteobacteria bacterium]|nr:DUF2066 domain-containing protein [Gammaproteobacteria bacterium]